VTLHAARRLLRHLKVKPIKSVYGAFGHDVDGFSGWRTGPAVVNSASTARTIPRPSARMSVTVASGCTTPTSSLCLIHSVRHTVSIQNSLLVTQQEGPEVAEARRLRLGTTIAFRTWAASSTSARRLRWRSPHRSGLSGCTLGGSGRVSGSQHVHRDGQDRPHVPPQIRRAMRRDPPASGGDQLLRPRGA
jgi:hypothetical protein